MEEREQRIYSKRIAIALFDAGCECLRIENNPYKPKFKVWVFKKTSKVLEVMTKTI